LVAEFQHGLVRLDAVLIALILVLAGLAFAALWMRLGIAIRRRLYESAGLAALASIAIFTCTFAHASWDLSENRNNSFPEPDEQALRRIAGPLRIEVHLAPEDPRRVDLERHALSKLRRVVPGLQVQYVSATSIGLFEQTNAGYGEIWYELGGQKAVEQSTIEEVVLEQIYKLANVSSPERATDDSYPGYPLAVQPKYASAFFYLFWPLLVIVCWVMEYRK
jgi:hypothetical protein